MSGLGAKRACAAERRGFGPRQALKPLLNLRLGQLALDGQIVAPDHTTVRPAVPRCARSCHNAPDRTTTRAGRFVCGGSRCRSNRRLRHRAQGSASAKPQAAGSGADGSSHRQQGEHGEQYE
jgi:hypothetical protein